MSNESVAESGNRTDAVVSVRFTTEEVDQLKRLAEAQKVPLSALIRRAALRVLEWTPSIASFAPANEATANSGWASYGSSGARAGSWTGETSVAITYRTPRRT